MVGPIIKSVLKAGTDKLPDDFKTRARSLPNLLNKMGVKDEEAQFQLGVTRPESYGEQDLTQVSKAELEQAVSNQQGEFGVETTNKHRNMRNLPDGAANPTYRENVYTFKQKGVETDVRHLTAEETENLQEGIAAYGDFPENDEVFLDYARSVGWDENRSVDDWLASMPTTRDAESKRLAIAEAFVNPETNALYDVFPEATVMDIAEGIADGRTVEELQGLFASGTGSRYTSSHFGDVDNYLMHTATLTDTVGGKNTHVIMELQSDLHQAGRQLGYNRQASFAQQELDELKALAGKDEEAAAKIATEAGMPEEAHVSDWLFDQQQLLSGKDKVPESPYKNSWLSKSIEREIAVAIDEGIEQIAIPIKGNLSGLKRGKGVQKWYEDKVLGAARKIAKANGMDFKLVGEGSANTDYTKDSTLIMNHMRLAREHGINETKAFKQLEDAFPNLSARDIKDVAGADSVGFANSVIEASAVKAERLDVAFTILENFKAIDGQGRSGFEVADRMITLYPDLTRSDIYAIERAGSKSVGARILEQIGYGNSNAIEYAVITPKVGVRPEFSLYSVEMGGILMAYEASKFGYSEEEVAAELVKKGYSEEESQQAAKQAKQAVESGATKEELQAHLTNQEPQFESRQSEPKLPAVPPEEGTRIGDAYRALIGDEEMSPKDLVTNLEVLAPDTSFMVTHIAGFMGNEEAARRAAETGKAAETKILAMMQARGLTAKVENGEYLIQNEKGEWEGSTPGFWQRMNAAGGELTGAVAGGIAGGRLGLALTAAVPIPGARVAGVIVGSVIGAVVGGVAGTEIDYMHSAILLSEDMNAEVAASKALTAAEASVVGDMIGLGVFKIVGKSWTTIVKAKNFIKDGGFDRAKVALREQLFITDDEAAELVNKLAKVANVPGKNRTEREIAAAMTTQPGSEGIVRASTVIDPKASAAVSKAIDDRAQDLLKATAEVSDANVGRLLKGELEAYTSAVKENFTRVKKQAAQAPRANSFRFKFDALALDPVFERLGKNIDNPDVAYKFAKQVEKIRDMSSTRSFGDLLELRTLVNEFKYNKRIRSAKDFDMLNDVLGRIDSTINTAAHVTLDNPKQWLSDFSSARGAYAKMKQLEKNSLMKIVSRPGVDEKVIAKAVAKYAYALDDTFVEAMAVLPKATRAKVEGTVLDNLANKYTAGLEGGQRATNFPLLAKDIEGVTFSSPDARVMKKAIIQLAEVFRNDIPLAQSTGKIQIPTFQSFLTADPVIRAKFEIASSVFNTIKSMAPGSKARTLQLVKKTALVLENPVHSKSIKELSEALQGEVDIQPLLEQLAMDTARRKAATGMVGMPKLKLYGDGAVLTTKGKGAQQSVPMHRIASLEDARTISEVTGINQSDRKALDHALKQRGYSAVQLGTNSVRKLK